MNAEQAWATLAQVLDPEVPVLSVVDLGIVREIAVDADDAVAVTLTPTYSGCPATEVIEQSVIDALRTAGASAVTVRTRLSPAWTTDWIQPAAAEKLREYGIAPPHLTTDSVQPIRFHSRRIACPRCGSTNTQQLSAFGATACKSLQRCLDCREPFEYFKPI